MTVELDDGPTGAFEGDGVWVVDPQSLIQINNVIRAANPDHDDGVKRIVVSSNRWVYTNASRVNPWGDPVTSSPFIR